MALNGLTVFKVKKEILWLQIRFSLELRRWHRDRVLIALFIMCFNLGQASNQYVADQVKIRFSKTQ